MVLGEVFLGAFLQVLFDRLASSEVLTFARRGGARKELQKWRGKLSAIQTVLEDAEEKQLTDKSIKNWLENLRDLAFDVEDVLDKFAVEALRHRLKVQNFNPSCTRFSPRDVKFNFRIVSEINSISKRLDDISKQRIELGLEMITGGKSASVWHRPPSTSVSNEARVYGRDGDRDKILELLLMNEPSEVSFQVVPIVGMGGVGKTTLAQLVFNDEAVKCFNLRAWVCVSEEFDVLRITKVVLESITSVACDLKDFNQIQVRLKEALGEKRFLIVLDDVWNKNYGEWNRLQAPFRAGAPGSKIIVTTRDSNVASMMGAVNYHNLEHISDDDCWSVFAQHAFENREIGLQSNLEKIGRKIVRKCKGLPLAARTLGGLLRSKQREDEWEDVLNSRLWNIPDEECEILPVLRLSYHHLPSHLKRCFSYCSILPKDYEFEEEELVLLWMAEGLIQQPEENRQMEDLGCQYFRELLARSLFQPSSRDKSRFMMHDLISDLAQWVAGDICYMLDEKLGGNKLRRFSPKARYSSYICSEYDDAKRFEALSEGKSLRTFLPLMSPYPGKCYLTSYVPFHLLPKLKCLRVLSLSGYKITALPNSVWELQLLRYLNLSYTNIKCLPESTGSLYWLQTLLLRGCFCLKRLPTYMGNLINLRHLDISNGCSIEEMPPGIKNMTSLQMLSDFVIGKHKGSTLSELMDLRSLKGVLSITRLENVTNVQDARHAKLRNKEHLDVLFLKWNSGSDDSQSETVQEQVLDVLQPHTNMQELTIKFQEQVLDVLQPHTNMKELTIKGYGGTIFPTWLADPSFHFLAFLRLENCEKCRSLPPLGLLPALKELAIVGMPEIKSVGPEFHGESSSTTFPSLERLSFQAMSKWEQWIPYREEEFPCLRELWIGHCPELIGNLPAVSLLQNLVILECKQLLVSIPSFSMLCKLHIRDCKEVLNCGMVNFSSPNSMVVSKIPNLTCLSENFTQSLKNVKELKIFGCEALTSLWQTDLLLYRWLTSLHHLVIEGCPQLVSLIAQEEEEQLQRRWNCRLKYLELRHCQSLMRLPRLLNSFISLQELVIEACPKLVSFPEGGLPPMIRVIRIKNCSALAPLPAALVYNSACLENLYVEGCDSLISFGISQLPRTLKRLEIKSCKNLQCLLACGESSSFSSFLQGQDLNTSSLEYLHICDCPALSSLSSGGGLPAALKYLHIEDCSEIISLLPEGNLPPGLRHLSIEDCPKFESIAERFQDDMALRNIHISGCENLEALPDGLHNLSHLQEISIWYCPRLVSFPRGLPSTNLRELCLSWCENLEALPIRLHNLTSLKELWIYDCPGILSFPEEGFPVKLTSLTITNLTICEPFFQWGLHRLDSLKELYIEGGCLDVVSFPQDEVRMELPPSLKSLSIIKFPNLKSLSSRGCRNLTSLEYLSVLYCHKLKFLPENGLPSSLLQLCICGCPLLAKRCKKNKGPEWFKVAHIPCVRIDGRFIYD